MKQCAEGNQVKKKKLFKESLFQCATVGKVPCCKKKGMEQPLGPYGGKLHDDLRGLEYRSDKWPWDP